LTQKYVEYYSAFCWIFDKVGAGDMDYKQLAIYKETYMTSVKSKFALIPDINDLNNVKGLFRYWTLYLREPLGLRTGGVFCQTLHSWTGTTLKDWEAARDPKSLAGCDRPSSA
jgi:hypothetical protein